MFRDFNLIREEITDRYTAPEIAEVLDLTSEEMYDILELRITDNVELFDLIRTDHIDDSNAAFQDRYIEETEEEPDDQAEEHRWS